jgi:multiple sugar transport system substrate-binding protein
MIGMEEIAFSIGNQGPVGMSNLRMLLNLFERQHGIHVRLDDIPLSALRWPRLVEAALYHGGPDISEAGSSWIGDLVRMDALRPFEDPEIADIIGARSFLDTAWKSAAIAEHGHSTCFSIPFSMDVRAIFYRRDMLAIAGVDEEKAFSDFQSLENTLTQLLESGFPAPLALPTKRTSVALHCLASWIWGAGGDFLDNDGMGLAFIKPEAIRASKDYYGLVRFLSPDIQNLEEYEADAIFHTGKAAVLISGFWVLGSDLSPEVRENLGVVPMPGSPFIGGGNLVIWNHSRHLPASLKLIQFLHSEASVTRLYPWFGLPVSEKDWSTPPFDSQIYQILKAAIAKGRSFPNSRLWGLVEKRLTDTVADIWIEVLREPAAPPDAIIEAHFQDLADRLRLSFGVK